MIPRTQPGLFDARNCACESQHRNAQCPGEQKCFASTPHCRSSRHDIINKQDPSPGDQILPAAEKRTTHIFLTLRIRQTDLRKSPDQAAERRFGERDGKQASKLAREYGRLIETAFAMAFRVEGDRNDQIDLGPVPSTNKSLSHQWRKETGEISPAVEFQSLNQPAQLGPVIAEGARPGKGRHFQSAVSAKVFGAAAKSLKGDTTGRTPREGDLLQEGFFPAGLAHSAILMTG